MAGLIRHKPREHGQPFFQPLQKQGGNQWARADTERKTETRGPREGVWGTETPVLVSRLCLRSSTMSCKSFIVLLY